MRLTVQMIWYFYEILYLLVIFCPDITLIEYNNHMQANAQTYSRQQLIALRTISVRPSHDVCRAIRSHKLSAVRGCRAGRQARLQRARTTCNYSIDGAPVVK